MPDTLFISTGVSLGLIAGIVSGVCYIVANGITWSKDEIQRKKKCLSLSADAGICSRCGGDLQGGILPCICITSESVKFERGAWFLRQAQRALSLMPWSLSTDKLEQIDEEYESDGEAKAGRDLRNVREFLEALSTKLAGGPIEGTRVAPLYDHPAYLPGRSSASSPAPSNSASNAHAQLKRLVARVVEEAAALPALAQYAAEPPRTPSVEGATYEDLLATAILNKVIERYQENGSGGRSSGIHSASASPTPSERSSPRSLRGQLRDITPPLNEEDEESSDWERGKPRRVPFPEFGRDIVHVTDNDDRDFDEVSGSDIQGSDSTWEENWLFQKKKIKTMQSVPVPMLVPNSTTDYRALIGDRDADDTTDLSDNASENEEEEGEYKSDIKRVLDSKHLIGGKTKIEELDFEPDSLTIIDDDNNNSKDVTDAVNDEVDATNAAKTETINDVMNGDSSVLIVGMDSGPLSQAEFNVKEEIHRTFMNANGLIPNGTIDSGKDSLQTNKDFRGNTLNGHEREGEYEETVTVPVQRYADSLRRKHFDDVPQTIPTRDTDNDEDLIPGSIADRERKKWLNYVEMPNNPYSPEAIQKRLTAKSTSSLFDMITKGNIDEPMHKNEDDNKVKENEVKEDNVKSLKDDVDEIDNGKVAESPPPKILKDVIAEEVPQFKRYDRDYYVKEARISSGSRKRGNFSSTSSLCSMNKSTSLDNISSEMATVSASSSLSDLEAAALHHSLSRLVLCPRNASPNFAINPIFENPDRNDERLHTEHVNGLLIQQFNTIASNQEYTIFADKSKPKYTSITMITSNDDKLLIDYEDNHLMYEAKPVYVNDDTDKKIEEIVQSAYSSEPSSLNIEIDNKSDATSPKSPIDSTLSSSSLDDSIKIYNVPTGEIVKNTATDKVSQRYTADRNDNIDIPDNNEASRKDAADSVPVIVEEILRENQLGSIAEVDEILPKVRELAKKFVSMDNLSGETNGSVNLPLPKEPITKRRKSRDNILQDMNDQSTKHLYMHSLTARSISRQFRQELKLSMATPLKIPGGTNEVPEGIEEVVKESSRPGSPLPEPGTIKSKLAFFEGLKSKFSTK